MKNLTTEEFDKAPKVIQFLHISAISKIEVRNSIIKNAMVEYPEYFEDNIEREKKWASVPKEVRDAFIIELWSARNQIFDGFFMPGIHDYGFNHIEFAKRSKKLEEIEKELYKKYYGPYGL